MRTRLEEKTILLVENNPDDEVLLLRAFHRTNLPYRLLMARTGTEAIQYLLPLDGHVDEDELENEPDLVLLDLKLPQMSGFEVLRRVRGDERTRLLPIVVLSSSAEPRDIVQSYTFGANSYIQKSIDLTEFNSSIWLLVEYWLRINQPPPKR